MKRKPGLIGVLYAAILAAIAGYFFRTAQLSGGIFDLYEIVPGFVCGLIAIFVVSLLTAAPSKEITDEFDSYRS